MADEKLESFKIGDHQRPTVARPAKKQAKAEGAEQQPSLGFARIEGLLEDTDKAEVAKSLSDIITKLESFEAGAKSNKDKAAAKRAMAAVERTVDLMDYLFATKEQLEQGG